MTPHVCRHTFCSNQARAGMNPKVLQYVMGHSEIRGDAQHVHASWLRGGSRGDEPAIRLNMRGVRSSVLHHFLHRIGMKKPVRI